MTRLIKYRIALLFCILFAIALFPIQVFAENYSCTASIPVRVSLTGKTDTDFTIQISAEDEAPMPKENTLEIHGSGQAAFEAITFTEPGEYQYTVRQQEKEIPYLTCDNTVYHVTIRVVNTEDGKLRPEIWANKNQQTEKASELLFSNVYDSSKTFPGSSPNPNSEQITDTGTSSIPDQDENKPSESTNSIQSTSTSITKPHGSPQTGDQFPYVLLTVVMCLALIGLVVGVFVSSKN